MDIAILVNLISRIGKSFVFLEFIAFSAVTFWLTTPLLVWELEINKLLPYNLFGVDGLAIKREEYYHFAIPATLSMVLGLYLIKPMEINMKELTERLKKHISEKTGTQIPLQMFAIGAFSYIIGPFLPSALKFFFYLASQLVFIAVLYCFFGKYTYKKWIYWGAGFLTLISVASSGMFGDLVWWGLVLAIYFMLMRDWSFLKKSMLIILAVFSISFLQTIKIGYRQIMWRKNKQEMGSFHALGHVTLKALTNTNQSRSNPAFKLAVFRVNQAYLVSLVLKHVPKKEPFANGETIFGSLLGSFVPRFLWPNKPVAGGFENIRRFGGYEPYGNTAMDIGQIGDAWANFGYGYGILFLFLYGLANAGLLRWMISSGLNGNLSIILWLPIVFLMLLKVETSVVTTFNAALKGIFFIFISFRLGKMVNLQF